MSDIRVATMNQRAARAVRLEGRLLMLLAAASGILILLMGTLLDASWDKSDFDFKKMLEGIELAQPSPAYQPTVMISWLLNLILLMLWGRIIAPQPQAPLEGGFSVTMPRILRTIRLMIIVALILAAALLALFFGAGAILQLVGIPPLLTGTVLGIAALAVLLLANASMQVGVAGISIGMKPTLEDLDNFVKPRMVSLILWTFAVGFIAVFTGELLSSAMNIFTAGQSGPFDLAARSILNFISQAYVMAGVMALPEFADFAGSDDMFQTSETQGPANQGPQINLDDEL